ncbi:MAG: DUF2715 domain-containing protein [Treponemataceae bacterium]
MKRKIMVIFLFLAVFSTQIFATEFFVTPKIGGAYLSNSFKNFGKEKFGDVKPDKASWFSGVAGIGLGFVSDNGVMLLFNNDLHFAGTLKSKVNREWDKDAKKFYSEDEKYSGGLYFWQSVLILGYSYKPMENLSCNFGLGLSFGRSRPRAKKYESVMKYEEETTPHEYKSEKGFLSYIEQNQFGFAIHADIQYYFTKNVGITFELQDIVGRGLMGNISNGVFNNFSFKFGPAFKF